MPFGLKRIDAVALIVAGSFFMEGLDATVIAPAIPQMANAFGTTSVALSAGISAYLVTVAIVVPASRWAAERFGVRTVFCTAIAIFTVASVLCGLSTNLAMFTAARVLQGIGGALMSPVGRMEVLRKTEKHRLMRAMALISWPGLTSFIIGPPLGGFVTAYISWNWIFFINVPIGIAGFVLVLLLFDNEKSPEHPFDAVGFALNGGALAILMYGLDLIGHQRTDWTTGFAFIVAGLALGALAIRHARRHPHPLLSPAPFRVHTFAVGILRGGVPFRMVVSAGSFLFPMLFQIGLGFNAFLSGLLMAVYATGDLGIKLFVTMIVRRFTFYRVLVVNGVLIALTTLACAAFTPGTPLSVMVVVLVLVGACRSLQFTASSSISYAEIPPEGMANATALFSMFHQVSLGLGVAISAIVLNLSAYARTGGLGEPELPDFRIAIYVMTAIALASVVAFARIDRMAGAVVSGHAKPMMDE